MKLTKKSQEMYNEVEKIIGQPLYLVGGCTRDELMGKEPKDYDFTTPLDSNQIIEKLHIAQRRAYLTGWRFGTIGVKIEGQLVEITTFRTEHYEPRNRKPKVEFVKDIVSDLSRRDFTINAIAYRDGKHIDPFNGIDDIFTKTLKAVGNPNQRFREDPLRILRAVRLAAKYDMTIETQTWLKAKELSYKVLDISKERWCEEMDKILMLEGDKVLTGLNLLQDLHIMNYIIPELSLQVDYDQGNPNHSFNLWSHTCLTVANTPAEINLRWAALLHDVAKPFVRAKLKKEYYQYIHHETLGAEIVQSLGLYLHWSNDRIKQVSELVLHHMEPTSPLKEADIKAKGKGEQK
jgi:tRNA nucleotidyltransferase/poly(A) polymerase